MNHPIDWEVLAVHVIAGASVLHTILPPWEFLNDFPTAQKVYKVFVYLVGYVALNARSAVYQSLSTKEGKQPSPLATNGVSKPVA